MNNLTLLFLSVSLSLPLLADHGGGAPQRSQGELICEGNYENSSGAKLAIEKAGNIVMTVGNNTANCTGEMAGGRKIKITCKGGLNSSGEFSDSCDSVTFNNDTYKRK